MSNIKSRLLAVSIVAALGMSAYAIAANSEAPGLQRARGLIDTHGASIHRADGDAFTARGLIVDADGTEHARFNRTYLGLQVLGGDFVVHSKNGQFKSASQTLRSQGRPNMATTVSASDAIVEAGTHFGPNFVGTPSTQKVVYARNTEPKVAWEVTFDGTRSDQTPVEMHYIVDANSAVVLDKWDAIETGKPGTGGTTTCTGTAAAGTGNTIYSGSVGISTSNCGTSFQMKDLTRGGGYTTDLKGATRGTGTIFSNATNTWGNGSNADRASAAADAHYGIASTWDYFKNVHGRNGIDGAGTGALSKVHYGSNYVNAFWSDSCYCMTFGDGDGVTYGPLVNLDVAGHEMTHGVTSRTAALTYSGESGGLNESNSDIFGTMVEFAASAPGKAEYLIGNELYINNPGQTKAFRYMYNPALEGAGRSVNCWYSGVGSLDVHYSSGPSNHYFYLLAEGSAPKPWLNGTYGSPTCNGSAVTGIGRDAAAKIQYRALSVYMTSSTNYAGARAASLSAATDLYGAGSAQYAAVAAAWSAVSVN